MATFNGAPYLRDQLDSLATQAHLPVELVVCDDRSTDETVEIIKSFSSSSPFPVKLHLNEENLGFAENFLKAARLCRGDWVAFCDQDDVWLPNKLGDAWTAIRGNRSAVLILQNAYLCTESLSNHGRLFPDSLKPGYYPPRSQYGFWVWLGCLQTFRADCLDLLMSLDLPTNYYPGHEKISHDKWTCMIANTIGGFYVIEGAAALYRRHERAATGYYPQQTLLNKVNKALAVTGEHYQFLSCVAEDVAAYLTAISDQLGNERKMCFKHGSKSFESISIIQNTRAKLYNSGNIFARLKYFLQILLIGGYVGHKMTALGWKSGAKDILRVFRVFSELVQ